MDLSYQTHGNPVKADPGLLKAAKMDAVVLTHNSDQPFISQLEAKNEGIHFQRIDADVSEAMKSKTSKKAEKEFEEQAKEIGEIMKKALCPYRQPNGRYCTGTPCVLYLCC